MKLSCPSCGAGGSYELFMSDTEWRDAVTAAAKLPSDCGPVVMRYVGMFRPVKRYLTPDRAGRLIQEICEMITGGIDFDRQHIQAPSHVWRQALVDMLDAPNVKRPLKNHNYLLKILQSKLSQRADMAQGQRADERRSESRGESGLQRTGDGPAKPRRPAGNAPAPEDPLDKLSDEDRERWLRKAEVELLDVERFSPQFLSKGLIEQKAREMLMDYQGGRDD